MKEYVDMLKFHGSDMDFRGGNLFLQDHGGGLQDIKNRIVAHLDARFLQDTQAGLMDSLQVFPIPGIKLAAQDTRFRTHLYYLSILRQIGLIPMSVSHHKRQSSGGSRG